MLHRSDRKQGGQRHQYCQSAKNLANGGIVRQSIPDAGVLMTERFHKTVYTPLFMRWVLGLDLHYVVASLSSRLGLSLLAVVVRFGAIFDLGRLGLGAPQRCAEAGQLFFRFIGEIGQGSEADGFGWYVFHDV